MRERWQPGETVLLRGLVDGRIRWALPHVLVEDAAERVALYCAPGVRGKRPRGAFVDFPEQLLTGDWQIQDQVWHTHHVLRLTPLGPAHSVDLYWSEAWEFRGWYANMQEPLRRTRLGFDTRDHALDITVEPDGTWAWKDEHHVEQLVGLGVYTADQAREFRAEGERVLEARPWPTGWEHWRPDPSWPLPALPDGWDVV